MLVFYWYRGSTFSVPISKELFIKAKSRRYRFGSTERGLQIKARPHNYNFKSIKNLIFKSNI